jgi:integrase
MKIREPEMNVKRITKRVVDSTAPAANDRFLWDGELPGFGLKVTPRGAKTYVFQYTKGRRKRRYTIGSHGAPWTPDEARKEALRQKGRVAAGYDPADERARAREVPVFSDFAKRYMEDYAKLKKKPSSLYENERILEKLLKPRFGTQQLGHITRPDIARFHLDNRATPFQANRAIALLSNMMNIAEKWGLRPDGSNPCRHIEKFPERRRQRFLSEAEWNQLGIALAEAEKAGAEPISAIAAIRMLAFTGCRVSEVLTLEWEHVDLERGCLRLPDSKTGAKLVPLSAPARQILDHSPRIEGNPYAFPGRRKGSPLVGLSHIWGRIREKAKLNDVRLHDLRHSYASVGAAGGLSLHIIGTILGHRQSSTTHRYAHLSEDPVRAAADRIAGSIQSAMKGTEAKILRFGEPGRTQ